MCFAYFSTPLQRLLQLGLQYFNTPPSPFFFFSFFLMQRLTSPLGASSCNKPPACIFSFSPLECSSYRRNPGSAHRGHSVPAAHHQPRYVAWCSAAAVALSNGYQRALTRLPCAPHSPASHRPSRSAPAGVSRSQRDSVHHPADPAADPPAAADAARRRAGTCHTAGNRLEVLDR